ncbi:MULTISPECIES: hypothetical protein [Nocardioides]|uniref:Uncharacterized protein n=1 Tax=Nocardioides lianchengensis TaxID=1045774 RepID=A0A1G6TEE6_9ACTN|nr:hypothetical protein [Nocardioides lianchengensis]NYG11795.1 hypothetical protein [Nocardioides lianchengensis]SDD26886.1 hypothetical protein SAMN05421872_10739 [Nocardioides lianchengensis]
MLKFLFVVALFALATYLVVRVIQRRGILPPTPGGTKRPGPRPQPRIVAPDDDEDFLRDLDRKRRLPEDPEDPDSA